MTEDMDKEGTVRLNPRDNALEKTAPIGHVFEHLDRNDAIEFAGRGKVVDVRGYYGEVAQPVALGAAVDVGALCLRI